MFMPPKNLLNAAINSDMIHLDQLSSGDACGILQEGSVFEDWRDRPN
jgi:hypothetical protein